MNKFLESARRFLKAFFSEYDPGKRFLETVTVYTFGVGYGPSDEDDDPHHTIIVLLSTPSLIEKYGLRVAIESKNLYYKVKTGDRLTIWLEENPNYNGKRPETRLRMAESPR